MAVKLLRDFLEAHHIKYSSINHSPSYTAQEIAAVAHVSGKQIAKTVIVKAGDRLVMVVLPATDYINFNELKELTGSKSIELAKESEFKSNFPECEVGAMPPFGNLFGLPVFVSSRLIAQDQIAFNAGSHSELIKMSYQDFERLVKPKVITMH